MAIFNSDLSSEMLLRNFLKELLTDPAVTPVVALHLAKQDPESRWRIVSQLSQVSNLRGKFWGEEIEKITDKKEELKNG